MNLPIHTRLQLREQLLKEREKIDGLLEYLDDRRMSRVTNKERQRSIRPLSTLRVRKPISKAERARRSAAQRARWDKIKAAKKTQ